MKLIQEQIHGCWSCSPPYPCPVQDWKKRKLYSWLQATVFFGFLVWVFFKVRVIASFNFCSCDEGIFHSRNEVLLDKVGDNCGHPEIVREWSWPREGYSYSNCLCILCIVILLEIWYFLLRRKTFVVFLSWGPAALNSSFPPSPPTVTSECRSDWCVSWLNAPLNWLPVKQIAVPTS